MIDTTNAMGMTMGQLISGGLPDSYSLNTESESHPSHLMVEVNRDLITIN